MITQLSTRHTVQFMQLFTLSMLICIVLFAPTVQGLNGGWEDKAKRKLLNVSVNLYSRDRSYAIGTKSPNNVGKLPKAMTEHDQRVAREGKVLPDSFKGHFERLLEEKKPYWYARRLAGWNIIHIPSLAGSFLSALVKTWKCGCVFFVLFGVGFFGCFPNKACAVPAECT